MIGRESDRKHRITKNNLNTDLDRETHRLKALLHLVFRYCINLAISAGEASYGTCSSLFFRAVHFHIKRMAEKKLKLSLLMYLEHPKQQITVMACF